MPLTVPEVTPQPGSTPRWLIVAGGVLAIASLAFVVRTLAGSWDDVAEHVEQADAGWLLLGAALGAAGMTAIALGWRLTIRLMGHPTPLGDTVARYFVGEIGKYLPGSLWPVVGRGELMVRRGLNRPTAYGSVGLGLGLLYLAAGLTAAAFLPFGSSSTPWWPLVAVPLGLVAIATGVVTRALRLMVRVFGGEAPTRLPSPAEQLLVTGAFVPTWVLIGIATWCIAESIGASISLASVMAATSLSWLAGFAVVPVPGGVGIREAVFIATLAGATSGEAATVAVVARVVFILVDVAGWAIGAAFLSVGANATVDRSEI